MRWNFLILNKRFSKVIKKKIIVQVSRIKVSKWIKETDSVRIAG
jgi:hypothetical protein